MIHSQDQLETVDTNAPLVSAALYLKDQDAAHLLRFYIIAIETILFRVQSRMPRDAYEAVSSLLVVINNIIPAFMTARNERIEMLTDGLKAVYDMGGKEDFSNMVDCVFKAYGEPDSDHLPDSIYYLNLLRSVDNAFAEHQLLIKKNKNQAI